MGQGLRDRTGWGLGYYSPSPVEGAGGGAAGGGVFLSTHFTIRSNALAITYCSGARVPTVGTPHVGANAASDDVPALHTGPVVHLVLRATQKAIQLRERARSKQALLYTRCRRIALAIGKRLTASGVFTASDDVFFITYPELDELLSGHAMFPGSAHHWLTPQ